MRRRCRWRCCNVRRWCSRSRDMRRSGWRRRRRLLPGRRCRSRLLRYRSRRLRLSWNRSRRGTLAHRGLRNSGHGRRRRLLNNWSRLDHWCGRLYFRRALASRRLPRHFHWTPFARLHPARTCRSCGSRGGWLRSFIATLHPYCSWRFSGTLPLRYPILNFFVGENPMPTLGTANVRSRHL